MDKMKLNSSCNSMSSGTSMRDDTNFGSYLMSTEMTLWPVVVLRIAVCQCQFTKVNPPMYTYVTQLDKLWFQMVWRQLRCV